MAGDGGNDAAAIRTADVGIGLTAQGSTAARNAADLVLTDPDPLVLLHALIEGRGMWRRVSDAVGILVGGNAGEVAFTVLGTALAGRAPLGTRQFLLVNMLTDMFPAMAVALATEQSGDEEPTGHQERADLLAAQLAARPPTDIAADLRRTIVIRGSTTAAASTVAWSIARWTGTERRAATVALVALVGTQLGQTVLAARHSPQVWLTAAGSAAFLGTVVMTPGLSTYFGCRPLGPVGWATALASAATATAAGALLPSRGPAEPEQLALGPGRHEYVLEAELVGAPSN
jgi:cation-transporting ATPase I